MKQKKTRPRVLFHCLLALLMPAWALALNLGDINLKSAPGQPLEAEIPVSGIAAEGQDSLSIGLADVAGFRWAGIEWSPALNQLQFELMRGADGAAYVRIHSADTMPTSSLHFLLKVAWSRGRLFREYVLELDAPRALPGEASAPEAPPTPAALASGRDWETVRAAVRDSRNYQVLRNDTLWVLARELRPDVTVSIQQMMLALLRTNPHAFSHGNINWLKAGETLWMPNDFELQAREKYEAYAEVLAHNNFWREARARPAGDAQWPTASGATAVDGGLRLVAVGEGDLEADDTSALDPEGTSRGQALTLANELVEELSQENVELENELSEAETIIEDLRRLVELKDDELAALQAQALQAQAGPGEDLAERADSSSPVGQKLKSVYDQVRAHWPVALAGLVALLALAGWLLWRRKPEAPPTEAAPGQTETDAGDLTEETDEIETVEESGSDQTEVDAEDFPDKITFDEETEEIGEVGEGAGPEEQGMDDGEADVELEEDRVQNKIDLARAYLELGDTENIRSILHEVLSEGNAAQREEARQLLEQADSG